MLSGIIVGVKVIEWDESNRKDSEMMRWKNTELRNTSWIFGKMENVGDGAKEVGGNEIPRKKKEGGAR